MSLNTIYEKCISGIVCISSEGKNNTYSTSSGFFIDNKHIVTCSHCVGIKNRIFIDIPGCKIQEVDTIGVDGTADIAVLRIHYPIYGITPLCWSTDMKIGDQCVAIGSPSGDVQSISNAYIRDTSFYGSNILPAVMESILIDGSAIGGNSGGPLLNMHGDVIGVIAYGYDSVSGGTMNGAVPSRYASSIVQSIIYNNSNYIHGTLNIKVLPLYIHDAIFLGLDRVQGYMVTFKMGVSPVEEGDIITHVEVDDIKHEVGQMNSQRCIFSLIHMNAGKRVYIYTLNRKISYTIPSVSTTIPQNGVL